MLAAPLIDWHALGLAALYALLGSLALVAAFGAALTGVIRTGEARRDGRAVAIPGALAGLGGVLCAGIVVVAILAMMHKS